ncbi:MAG: diaminopimelate decarboxylase, partial [Cytophagia bacterium]|nr:diaminopimelate decarboxylase [Cytophagia bacterium]
MLLENGSYTIQGISVQEIAKEFGTPLYVYDASTIVSQIKTLRAAFAGTDLRIKYAAKALTNVNILRIMKQQGIGIDVVSVNEARLAMHAGFTSAEIMFTPSGVDFDE